MEETATKLCTACGLCCSGVVLSGVLLRTDEERQWALRKRLPIISTPSGPAFAHPCPLLADTRCGDYESRPGACRRFRCKTLDLAVDGQIDLSTAQARIAELVSDIGGIERHVSSDVRAEFWRHAALVADGRTDDDIRASSQQALGVLLPAVLALRSKIDAWLISAEENARKL